MTVERQPAAMQSVFRRAVRAAGLTTTVLLAAPDLSATPKADGPNAVYCGLRDSLAALDTARMQALYAPGAVYLPPQASLPVQRHGEILDGTARGFAAMRMSGTRVDSRFRIVERHRIGTDILDIGYVRTVVTRPSQQPDVRTSKFMTLLRRDRAGRWRIAFDAQSGAPARAFADAGPVAGLHHDAD